MCNCQHMQQWRRHYSRKVQRRSTPEKENKGETTATLSLAIHAAFYCSLNQFSAFCVCDVRHTLLLTMGEDSICYFCRSSCAWKNVHIRGNSGGKWVLVGVTGAPRPRVVFSVNHQEGGGGLTNDTNDDCWPKKTKTLSTNWQRKSQQIDRTCK